MTTLTIPDELAERLQEIANQENRSVDILLESLLEQYSLQSPETKAPKNNSIQESLEAYTGSLDTDITDLSTTVRETITEVYKEKYGDTD